MPDCIHHWKQETGDIKAPFICVRCGASRVIETNFHQLVEQKSAGVTPWRGTGQREETTAENRSA